MPDDTSQSQASLLSAIEKMTAEFAESPNSVTADDAQALQNTIFALHALRDLPDDSPPKSGPRLVPSWT